MRVFHRQRLQCWLLTWICRRKTRCSGTWPCNNCSQSGLECKYNATYRRGRLPPIHRETDESGLLGRTSPGTNAGDDEETYRFSPLDQEAQQSETEGDRSSRSRPPDDFQDPSQNDQQGHYVGPSSAASVLLRIQRTVERQRSSVSSDSSIFTFGDLPLPEHDPSLFILPAESEGRALMARYFDFAAPTHRFLHRNTIEEWFRELYETNGEMRKKSDARSRTAVLLMVFAQAMIFSKSGTREQNARSRYSTLILVLNLRTDFYEARDSFLPPSNNSLEKREVSGSPVSKPDWLSVFTCWLNLVSITVGACLVIPPTSCWRLGCTENEDLIRVCPRITLKLSVERELFGTPTTWTLTSVLPWAVREPSTMKTSIRLDLFVFMMNPTNSTQELPTSVNDFDLHRREIRPVPANSLSIMSGCIAHIEYEPPSHRLKCSDLFVPDYPESWQPPFATCTGSSR